MNPETFAAKLDESLGIDGSGTGSGVGRLAEAYRLASELVDRPRGDSGTSRAKCPADRRIEAFLDDYFSDLRLPSPLRLPGEALVLPRHGLARLLSLPYDADIYGNDYVRSYRVRNGVLHNPKSDRRTTQGTFHVAEGGLPIPGDKKAVPRSVFAALFRHAVAPPPDLLVVPFTANRPEPLRAFVSLLLRPVVCPEVPGVLRGQDDGDPLLRARQPGQQPRLRRVDLRQRRRSLPPRERRRARRRALDGPHRLRDPRPAPDPAHQEGPRPAAPGTRPPSGSGATACAGATRTSVTTTAGPSSSPAAPPPG